MTDKFNLPEKSFLSKEEACKRWDRPLTDIDHYINRDQSLRLAAINEIPGAYGGNLALDLSSLSAGDLETLILLAYHWEEGETLDKASGQFCTGPPVPLLLNLPVVGAPIYLYDRVDFFSAKKIGKVSTGYERYIMLFEDFYGKPFLLLNDGGLQRRPVDGRTLTLATCQCNELIPLEEYRRFEEGLKIGERATARQADEDPSCTPEALTDEGAPPTLEDPGSPNGCDESIADPESESEEETCPFKTYLLGIIRDFHEIKGTKPTIGNVWPRLKGPPEKPREYSKIIIAIDNESVTWSHPSTGHEKSVKRKSVAGYVGALNKKYLPSG